MKTLHGHWWWYGLPLTHHHINYENFILTVKFETVSNIPHDKQHGTALPKMAEEVNRIGKINEMSQCIAFVFLQYKYRVPLKTTSID